MNSFTILMICALGSAAASPVFTPSSYKQSQMDRDADQLLSDHVTSMTSHPVDDGKLVYADETALYEYEKATGASRKLIGQSISGLASLRSSQDGDLSSATFKYISKLVSRPSGLYMFDYDKLRKYDFTTKRVSTVQTLTSERYRAPVIGDVSHDEKLVYWTNTRGEGHYVMENSLGDINTDSRLVISGPTQVGYMSISPDDKELILSDVEMMLIERVDIESGAIDFVTEYGSQSFLPGALAFKNTDLLAIDRNQRAIMTYDISVSPIKGAVLAGSQKLQNPFDMAVDSDGRVFVLEAEFHPKLPTYKYFIKEVEKRRTFEAELDDLRRLQKLLGSILNGGLQKFYV